VWCDEAAGELRTTADELMSSLRVRRESFEQQIRDAETLINDSADQICRSVDNERQRLLLETEAIRHNTVAELDKVDRQGRRQVQQSRVDNIGGVWGRASPPSRG